MAYPAAGAAVGGVVAGPAGAMVGGIAGTCVHAHMNDSVTSIFFMIIPYCILNVIL